MSNVLCFGSEITHQLFMKYNRESIIPQNVGQNGRLLGTIRDFFRQRTRIL